MSLCKEGQNYPCFKADHVRDGSSVPGGLAACTSAVSLVGWRAAPCAGTRRLQPTPEAGFKWRFHSSETVTAFLKMAYHYPACIQTRSEEFGFLSDWLFLAETRVTVISFGCLQDGTRVWLRGTHCRENDERHFVLDFRVFVRVCVLWEQTFLAVFLFCILSL